MTRGWELIQLEIPVNSGARSPTVPPTGPLGVETDVSDGWGLTAVWVGFVAATGVSCGGLLAAGLVGAWVGAAVTTDSVGGADTTDSVGAAETTDSVGFAEATGWDWESPGFEVGELPPQAAKSKVIAAKAATANGPRWIFFRDCNLNS